MSDNGKNKVDRLAPLPDEVRRHVMKVWAAESVLAVSAYDLGEDGKYASGYLVLGPGRLGHFAKNGAEAHEGSGEWKQEWFDLANLEVKVVEGLGMNALRLAREGRLLAEYRFSQRHLRSMSDLHVQLEREIGGDEPPAGRDDESPGDKKVHCDRCGFTIPDWAEMCPRCLQRRKVLMRLLAFVRPHKWKAIIGFSLSLFIVLIQLVRPLISKTILDDAIGKMNVDLLVLLIGAWGVTLLMEAAFGSVRLRLMSSVGMRVAAELRDKCYSHMQKLSLAYFGRKSTGSLITRVTSDSDRIWDFIAFNLIDVIISFVTFVGVWAVMAWVDWRLALLVLAPLPITFAMMLLFHKRMHSSFRRIWHRWSAMTAVVADAIPGVRVIKAFNQEHREIGRFHDKNYQVFNAEKGMVNTWSLFGPTMTLSSQIAFLIIWGVGGWWVIRDSQAGVTEGAFTVGALVAYTQLMWMFFQPMHQIAHMSRMFNRAATSVQRIFEVLDAEPEVFTKRNSKSLKHLRGHIEFRNVSFSYDGVRRVLRNVNLEIHPGQMVGLVGASGSGKTTLVNLLCRFYDPVEGQILIDGHDVRDYDLEDLRHFTGVVLQEPYLFRGTVAENIAYGRPDADVKDIIRAARTANVHDTIIGFPDGYDTLVGERGQTLSGGERQRVSIARAILNNPRLLILDEATSNVDTHTEKQIQEALDRLVSDRTTIAIAHRLSTLRRAHRLIVLDKGRIVEEGTHAQLEDRPEGVYANLLRMQMELKSVIALNE